jgi:opacity protein-like surface antigen
MIGKFATVSALLLMLGSQGWAQSAPSGQAPAAPPPSTATPAAQPPAAPATTQQPENGQEPADEASLSRSKKKPKDYKNWSFNVGAGANVDSGKTKTYVRGGGVGGSVGVARNANKYLGLRADFIFADLPLRDSALNLAQATGDTSYAFAVTVDPIINFSVTKVWSGYVLFGPSYIHRAGSLDDDTTVPGGACNGFWEWWGACKNFSIPLSGNFTNTSQNQFGYNFGGGVARKMPSGVEIYAEYRFMHGSGNGVTTDFRPITIGVRW